MKRPPGIVCERFCCGPPTVCEPDGENEVAWKSEKFYNSEYGLSAKVGDA